MPIRLDDGDAGFERQFQALLSAKREVSEEVDRVVADIIAAVRERGDEAVIDCTSRFDALELTAAGLRVSEAEIDDAVASCPRDLLIALETARSRIEAYHARQKPEDAWFTDAVGVESGWRWSAIEAVGLYVPGGTASYPSSVLMNAVPAKVAGVPRVVMV
ncbi:MAG: histidinol dehydrogenase, partial [Bosea sp. (in: a-proteobacteria)]